jgi:hypothetical protein
MANDFKPTIGGKVLKSDADAWIKKYDDEKKDKGKDVTSVFFGKDFLMEIIRTHPEAAGISFFYCKKHSSYAGKDVVDLILVPRKEDGTLIWPHEDGKDGTPAAYDNGKTCPPTC